MERSKSHQIYWTYLTYKWRLTSNVASTRLMWGKMNRLVELLPIFQSGFHMQQPVPSPMDCAWGKMSRYFARCYTTRLYPNNYENVTFFRSVAPYCRLILTLNTRVNKTCEAVTNDGITETIQTTTKSCTHCIWATSALSSKMYKPVWCNLALMIKYTRFNQHWQAIMMHEINISIVYENWKSYWSYLVGIWSLVNAMVPTKWFRDRGINRPSYFPISVRNLQCHPPVPPPKNCTWAEVSKLCSWRYMIVKSLGTTEHLHCKGNKRIAILQTTFSDLFCCNQIMATRFKFH